MLTHHLHLQKSIEWALSLSEGHLDIISEDARRLTNGYWGPVVKPLSYRGASLLIGARSGLEAILLLAESRDSDIFVIEPSEILRSLVSRLTDGKAKVFASLDEAVSAGLPRKISYCRIANRFFDLLDIYRLIEVSEIEYLSGEVDDTQFDPLSLYKTLRLKVGGFHLHLLNAGHSIAGWRKNAAVPAVSIVVPAYGVEAYIDHCLETLVHQSLNEIEIIVVDDGSPDNSGARAEVWAERFPGKVKVIWKVNGGCASARMAGLKAATGEYVGFVDGDDWVELTMYEDLYRAAALRNAEIGQCGFYEAYEDGSTVLHPTAWGADGLNGNVGLVRDPHDYLTLMPSIWRRIYGREFLLRNNIEFPEHIKRHDDLPFAFLTIAQTNRISVIPDCHYAYRLGRPGQDVSATDERLYVHFEIFDWLFSRVRPWAPSSVMSKLCEVEIGTHAWVLTRLQPIYREKYLKQAIEDISMRYEGYNSNPAWEQKLKSAASSKWKA